MNTNPKITGFTLIEMVVTIAILALIIALGVPSFQMAINNTRTAAQADRFYGALNLARSEAIKRNATVMMCKSSDGGTCDSSLAWRDGWLLYADVNGNGSPSSDEVIQAFEALSGGFTLTAGTDYQWIGYRSDGVMTTNAGVSSTAWALCPSNQDTDVARQITVSLVGRPAISKGTSGCP